MLKYPISLKFVDYRVYQSAGELLLVPSENQNFRDGYLFGVG
jgi:hypothetical protein